MNANNNSIRKKIGLALGSGSSRGIAHIGVIEALEEEKIPIDFIAGCSVGSYIGAVYAGGGLKSFKNFVLNMSGKSLFTFFDIIFPRSGFLDATKKVKELYYMHSASENFSDLKIPLKMIATDMHTGSKIIIDSGKIVDGLRATMSIPGLFEPYNHMDRWLVDGGLVDPVPVGIARAMGADIVIAVDLNTGLVSKRKRRKEKKYLPQENKPVFKNELFNKLYIKYEKAEYSIKKMIMKYEESAPPHMIDTLMSSIGIMQERITRTNLAVEPPDILIQPRLGDIKMLDFDQVNYCIEEGYRGVKEKINEIRMLLE